MQRVSTFSLFLFRPTTWIVLFFTTINMPGVQHNTQSLGLNFTPGPVFYICLAFTIIMLFWPWIFFGVTWSLGGIQMHHTAARIVHEHPQDTAFFVTMLCNGLSTFTAILFSAAVVSLSQRWVVHKDTTILHITLFSALKNNGLPISLLGEGNFALFVLAVVYFLMFQLVTPGITALLTPVTFNRTISLSGTELDFASIDTGCIDWFNNNTIPHSCDWMVKSTSFHTKAAYSILPASVYFTDVQRVELHRLPRREPDGGRIGIRSW